MHTQRKLSWFGQITDDSQASSKFRAGRRALLGATVLVLAGCGGGGGDDPGGSGDENDPPLPIAQCSTTPQSDDFFGSLQATDSDNRPNELTFSLDPNVPRVAGPIQTVRGTVELLDVTTGAFHYTPNPTGPRGIDSFKFRVDDPETFALATETIIVNPAIMALGDSITDGTTPTGGQPPVADRVGFRGKLFNDLVANGFRVDFVGGEQSGQAADIDPHHEGHGGFDAAEIADGSGDFPGIYLALDANPADIILLHIGTNSVNSNPDGTAADTGRILDEIYRWETENSSPVTVFLAQIIDRTTGSGSFDNPDVDTLNGLLGQLPTARPDQDILLVDQHNALNYQCGSPGAPDPDDPLCDMALQADGVQFVHPKQRGYGKMAARWLSSGLLTSDKLVKCN